MSLSTRTLQQMAHSGPKVIKQMAQELIEAREEIHRLETVNEALRMEREHRSEDADYYTPDVPLDASVPVEPAAPVPDWLLAGERLTYDEWLAHGRHVIRGQKSCGYRIEGNARMALFAFGQTARTAKKDDDYECDRTFLNRYMTEGAARSAHKRHFTVADGSIDPAGFDAPPSPSEWEEMHHSGMDEDSCYRE